MNILRFPIMFSMLSFIRLYFRRAMRRVSAMLGHLRFHSGGIKMTRSEQTVRKKRARGAGADAEQGMGAVVFARARYVALYITIGPRYVALYIDPFPWRA